MAFISLEGLAKTKLVLRHHISDAQDQRIPHRSKVQDTVQARNEAASAERWLHRRDFLLASVDSTVCSIDTCTIYVHLGPKYSGADIWPSPSVSKAFVQAGLSPHRPLRARQYLSSQKRILRYYEDTGYPFAELVLDCLSIDSGRVRALLICNPGKQWAAGQIIFSDSAGAHSSFLYNQINILPGDRYSQKHIDNIPERINELAFIESTGIPEVSFDVEGQARIMVPAQRVRANAFDGILGFAPGGTDNEQLVVTGTVSLQLHNALHRGEELKLEWRKLDQYSQNASVEPSIKYIMGSRIGCNAGLWIDKQDTSILNTQILAQATYFFKSSSSLGARYRLVESKLITAEAYDSISHRLHLLESRLQLAGLSYRISRADRRINPRKGHSLQIDASSGAKRYRQSGGVPDSVFAPYSGTDEVFEVGYDAAVVVPLSKPFVLMIANAGKWLYAPSLFQNELYRIGGAKSLRGFNEQSIYASAYSIGTAELRLLLDSQSNMYVFYNQAVYRSSTVNGTVSDMPLGFGLGLNVASRNATFSISYAVGRQFGNPVLFSAGKIHFGLVNRF